MCECCSTCPEVVNSSPLKMTVAWRQTVLVNKKYKRSNKLNILKYREKSECLKKSFNILTMFYFISNLSILQELCLTGCTDTYTYI